MILLLIIRAIFLLCWYSFWIKSTVSNCPSFCWWQLEILDLIPAQFWCLNGLPFFVVQNRLKSVKSDAESITVIVVVNVQPVQTLRSEICSQSQFWGFLRLARRGFEWLVVNLLSEYLFPFNLWQSLDCVGYKMSFLWQDPVFCCFRGVCCEGCFLKIYDRKK